MGILLVYDVTDEGSFKNVRNWMQNIEQHASEKVNKILVGNKSDMGKDKRAVSYTAGEQLAKEYGIPFFETSAKTGSNVDDVFYRISRNVLDRLKQQEEAAQVMPPALPSFKIGGQRDSFKYKKSSSSCCQ